MTRKQRHSARETIVVGRALHRGRHADAWAGQKSFQRKNSDEDDRNPPPRGPGSNSTVNWHKEQRSNETHESLTDSSARLFKKTGGAEARLGYLGHLLTENRRGLVVDVRLTQAAGTAERDAVVDMIGVKVKKLDLLEFNDGCGIIPRCRKVGLNLM